MRDSVGFARLRMFCERLWTLRGLRWYRGSPEMYSRAKEAAISRCAVLAREERKFLPYESLFESWVRQLYFTSHSSCLEFVNSALRVNEAQNWWNGPKASERTIFWNSENEIVSEARVFSNLKVRGELLEPDVVAKKIIKRLIGEWYEGSIYLRYSLKHRRR